MPRSNSLVSVICSTYNRPELLKRLIQNLKAQTHGKWELLVMDESPDFYSQELESEQVIPHKCDRFNDWGYSVKELGAQLAHGDYLCFPADDAQYDSTFLEKLLALDADFAFCDFVNNGTPVVAEPGECKIDVGGFLIRRQLFTGWVDKDGCGDGHTVEKWIREGAVQNKVPQILYFKT